jgi:group I intron endonuclease
MIYLPNNNFYGIYIMGVIYKIINVVTDDFYVGSAVNHKRRKWEHWTSLKKQKHHCVKLQQAWDEYGEDAFEFVIIEEVSDDDLLTVEDIYLGVNAGQLHCYNTALSTQIPSSTQREVREKISQSLKTLYANNPSIHPRMGRKHTEETRLKIVEARAASDKNKGENHYRYGKTVSEETRKKIGDTQRGVKKEPRVYTPEGLEKARENMKRNAVKQDPKPFSDVLTKFPQEVKDKYDFTNAVYTGALNRIEGCVCQDHGVFSQYAAQFRKGRGCPSCGAVERGENKRKQMKEFWASGEGHQVFRKPK